MPAIRELDRVAPFGLVAREILLGHDPVRPAHFRRDQTRRAPRVEALLPICSDSAQYGRELWIAPTIAGVRYAAVLQKERSGGREVRESRAVSANRAREVRVDHKPLLGQRDRRREELRPWT